MASELSKLIEDELEKVEGANRKDEHQRRLSSLRIKVSGIPYAFSAPRPQHILCTLLTHLEEPTFVNTRPLVQIALFGNLGALTAIICPARI